MSSPARPRLASVDILRGVAMVLMALDHTRGMVSGAQADPTNLAETTSALFLTRWSTHFCAPVFVFLAGTAAYLSTLRGKSKLELSRFLWIRGLWLIFLEFTLVRMGWSFSLKSSFVVGQVIWVLGCSMMVLAGLVYLPAWGVGLFGVIMIALHNCLDGFKAEEFGPFAWLWGILRGGSSVQLMPGLEFRPSYALVPWVGVMAAGYGCGPLLLLEPKSRRQTLLRLGLGMCAAFVLIRATNLYGDPQEWSAQKNGWFTCLSFINCTKYPPSLLFLLMTLGPGILLLALFEPEAEAMNWRTNPSVGPEGENRNWRFVLLHPFLIFGRVPLFYYLLHLPLIHLLAVLVSLPHYKPALGSFYYSRPAVGSGYGHDLWVVYAVWIASVLCLFPLCRWFASVKQRRKDAWLSYL